jgi:hypothetical protein|tara:strand:+ start:399 stop:563 length:165 start_codon:yes stop_codon:yes gene_type:complete
MAKDKIKIDKTIEIIKDFKKGWLPYKIAVERFSKATGLSLRIAEVLFNEQRKLK